ncbi:MAG: protein-L-isoaspartate(D-aspartate) O-methyltransferase [Pseudomonadota bacterium]
MVDDSQLEQRLQGIGMTSARTRKRMVERLFVQGIRDTKVLDVMMSIPRHIFLDEAMSHRAYEDASLPIGFNQTLSQPYTVARMTELLLKDGPLNSVLEIGTGSGYQTSVLSKLVEQVHSVERIKALQDKARQRLKLLDCYNISFRCHDGGMGWKDKGPFDGIISTAAPEVIPDDLKHQLVLGGRLVIPVGVAGEQELHVVTRHEDYFDDCVIEPVAFVPLLPGVIR